MCDLNQRTMQAFHNLALVHATFEHTGANMEVGDLPFGHVRTATAGLAESQHLRPHQEQKNARDSLDTALIELNNRRDVHDAAWWGLGMRE